MEQELQNSPQELRQRTRGKHPVYDANPSVVATLPVRMATHAPKRMDRAYMVSPETGEVLAEGAFVFIEEKDVDPEQFVKVYLEGIRQYGQLSKAGVHLFELVYREMSGLAAKDKDRIVLNHHIALKWNPKLPRSTFYRGMGELLDKGFLFRSQGADVYYVNIRYLFNGDRLALMKNYCLIR